jgi:hypothetical protein
LAVEKGKGAGMEREMGDERLKIKDERLEIKDKSFYKG